MQSFVLDEAQAGAWITLELLVMGVVALLIAPWMGGTRKRQIAWLAAGVIVVSELAAAGTSSASWMLVWLTGLGLGAGLMLAANNAIIAATSTPDKLFGYAFMVAYGITALLVFAMAPAIARTEHAGAYVVLAAFTALLVPWLRVLPNPGGTITADPVRVVATSRGVILLVGIALIGVGMMGFYAYIERLGVRLGLSPNTIALVFAFQQIASVFGAALAASHGTKVGLLRSLLISTLLHTSAILTAVFGDSLAWFATGVIAEGFTFLFLLPLQFTLAAQIDPSGRWAAAANGVLMISTGAAPFLVGVLISAFDYRAIGWLMLAVSPLGMWAFVTASKTK